VVVVGVVVVVVRLEQPQQGTATKQGIPLLDDTDPVVRAGVCVPGGGLIEMVS
jgi:hypothetical protein